ncbi:hypothetical protein [Neokomagataea thailandica]|uniref:hypothetical protein n=1 Tax=Neokomagataea TaxID=1223423 RepID=UPI000A9C6A7A|nr:MULTISPECIES: hypothetical protein [Neokomagataea]
MLRYVLPSACAGLTLALLSGCAAPSRHTDTQNLQERLASRPSATATLQSFCPSPIHVHSVTIGTPPAPAADIIQRLELTSSTALKLRHVQLLCGDVPVSDAWNWYVPERLTAEMNTRLEHSTTPFGRAVQDTHFSRTTISSTAMPEASVYLLENRAVLRRASDHAPISLVIEDYFPSAAINYR